MKNMLLCIFSILICACDSDSDSEDKENPIILAETVATLEYTLKEDYNANNIVHIKKYAFDKEGKVISENFTSIYDPEHSYLSIFVYDDKGRVTKEVRDGQIYRNIFWFNDVASVFNNQNQILSKFTFVGDKLTKYKTEINSSNVRTRKLNYDSNLNVISIENETEVFVEFLDYDTDKIYPFYLIKSIGVLRINQKPFFKNIFGVEKAYPYEGDDYSFPLTYYDYYYTYDSEDRVYEIEDDKSVIYTRQFIYQ